MIKTKLEDTTKMDVDAIVNSANKRLSSGLVFLELYIKPQAKN